jgi:VWFA-related protein
MPLRRFRVVAASLATIVGLGLSLSGSQDPPQQPPFRTATNLVRVDAYPTKDGRIIPGLTAADFELLEDGVVQKIDSFQYVEFPQNNPVEERRDPNSQREGFQLAADPTYRVFVVYLDNLHVDFTGSHAVRVPLITFLNRVLGPKDLFGVLTTAQDVKDLMLGQQTLFIEEQLTRYWDWGTGSRVIEDDADLMIESCFMQQPGVVGELVSRRRMDEVFSDLEGLVAKLGEIREERKNILLVSNGWTLPGRASGLRSNVAPRIPLVGVTDAGKLTMGRTDRTTFDPRVCEDFLQRLSDMDFQQRLRDLLRSARQANVTFYSIKPSGLVAPSAGPGGRLVMSDTARVDSLLTLSNNTDGIAVVNTNDLTAGARRIAQDLSAVYLLGYYSSNAKPDGRVRRIAVRLKPRGESVRARREYRAPSEADIAALREAASAPAPPATAAPVEAALAELRALRPGAVLHARGTVIGPELVLTTELTAPEVEAGRWREGAELQVMVSDPSGSVMQAAKSRLDPGQRFATVRIAVGEAAGPFSAAIRLRSDAQGSAEQTIAVVRPSGPFGAPSFERGQAPVSMRAAASPQFRRTERIRVRWPLLGDVGTLTTRLLGRDGIPIDVPVQLTTTKDGQRSIAVVDLNLAPLTAGEYLLEVSGTAPEAIGLLAFRVTR